MKDMKYSDKIHLVGRAGSIMSLCIMLGIPALICAVYDIWPTIGEVVSIGSGLLAIFVPTAISEVFSYTPILGSACYIAFITGNVLNLKLPCAVSAMELADVAQGSEEGDAISTVAIAASSMLTMVVIALGVVLLVPLQPILQQPAVQTATTYMLPALFGSMFFGMITSKSAGEYIIHGKLKAVVLPLIVIVLVNFFVTPISGKEGYAMLGAIPLNHCYAFYLELREDHVRWRNWRWKERTFTYPSITFAHVENNCKNGFLRIGSTEMGKRTCSLDPYQFDATILMAQVLYRDDHGRWAEEDGLDVMSVLVM